MEGEREEPRKSADEAAQTWARPSRMTMGLEWPNRTMGALPLSG